MLLDAIIRLVLAFLGAFIGLLIGVGMLSILEPIGAQVPLVDSLLSPAWSYLLPTLAFAGFAFGLVAPTLARNPRLCATCGYDLTGNRTGRCPECNSPVVPP